MTASTTWRNKGKHVLAGIGAAVFWLLVWQGISLLVAQELLVPGPAAVLRTLIGSVFLLAVWGCSGARLHRPDKRHMLYLAVSGAAMGGSWVLVFTA